MYFKIALGNVKKNFKDYFIYFATLTFSVCLFYVFNSFEAQQAVLEVNESEREIIRQLASILNLLSVIVIAIFAFLILYANNFLVKKRKKEMGIYMLLGMEKRKISFILILETMFIGLLSLVSGLILGLIIAQAVTALTAQLFVVPLNYKFVFSLQSTILTILSFTGIFVIVMLFNTFVLNRFKLINLLNADKQNEKLRTSNIWISVIIFILSVGCLYYSYTTALETPLSVLTNSKEIIGCGILGTVLFFMSLSGFMLKFMQMNPNLYYKNLNFFVFRQLNSSINSAFTSISVICIMLLLAIGALSTGLNISSAYNSTVMMITPYDMSIGKSSNVDYRQFLNENDFEYIDDFTIYKSSDMSFMEKYNDNKLLAGEFQHYPASVISLTDYNDYLVSKGENPIKLEQNETIIYNTNPILKEVVENMVSSGDEIPLYETKLNVVSKDILYDQFYTTVAIQGNFGFIVNDSIIPQNCDTYASYMNLNFKEGRDEVKIAKDIHDNIIYFNETHPEKSEPWVNPFDIYTKADAYETSKGMSVTFTYIGIYLGIVFTIASSVILALQQLSGASENRKRYMILDKLGVSKEMMNKAVFLQIAVYFMVPLVLAIIHSVVGIQAVSGIVSIFGGYDILNSSFITGGFILCFYGGYFLLTYYGYKRILYSKN